VVCAPGALVKGKPGLTGTRAARCRTRSPMPAFVLTYCEASRCSSGWGKHSPICMAPVWHTVISSPQTCLSDEGRLAIADFGLCLKLDFLPEARWDS
jgi:hypothetical protein